MDALTDEDLSLLLARLDLVNGVAHDSEVLLTARDRATAAAAVAAGALLRPAPGLLTVPEADPRTIRARSVGGRLTCCTAAAVMGCPTWYRHDEVHVVVPRNRALRSSGRRDLSGLRIHRRDGATPCTVDGFPLHAPAEVAAASLRCLDELDALCVVDAMLNRGHARREEIADLLTGRYDASARARLARADERARSPLETRLRLVLRSAGLGVRTGVALEGVGEVDLLVEEWLIVETDGWEFHRSREQFVKDRHRDQSALARGFVPVRLTSEDLRLPEDELVSIVVGAMTGVAHSSRMHLPGIG